MVNTVENESLPKSINNGPRVSFNRDVHVKRYGSQSNHNDSLNHDSLTSRSQSPANFRRELPADLSEEALEREAALVLEQANYFGSLPHRKNQHRKPVRRSISDASPKKSKRSSIFNLFNSTSTSTNSNSPVNNKKATNDRHSTNKKVERSKSDVSSRSSQGAKRDKKRNAVPLNSNSFANNLTNSSDSDNSNALLLTSTPKRKVPLSPITEVNSPLSEAANNRTDYFGELLHKSHNLSNGKGFASSDDLDLIPTSDKMSSQYSKSVEAMHSSQMPAERPALTKGAAVNKMIKRLSIERLSPPQQVIQAGGFSYTNPQLSPVSPLAYSPTKFSPLTPSQITKSDQPSSDIVYAQVVCNELKSVDGSRSTNKETVHITTGKNRESASPPNMKSSNIESVANFVASRKTIASPPTKGSANSYQYRNSVKIVTDFDRERDDFDTSLVTDDEPIIKPNIRFQIPRYPSNSNVNVHHHQLDNNDFDNHDMRDTDFNGLDLTLSNRREILESRIKSRIGGLQINNSDNGNTFVQHHIHRTSSSPPTTTKRYHKYGSNEIINRYSPERNHLDLAQSPSPSYERNNKSKNYADSTLRKKSYYYSKQNNGDSGIELDNVTKNNRKNKLSSRFNIGRKWNFEDDIIESELFLMKERRHTEETYPFQLVRTFVYRERSIDDGSHYDPNLDKANIVKEWKHNKKITKDFLKSKKKKSGLEKVKDLFKSKKTNGVDDNELKSKYREYSPDLEPPPLHQQDIASRRRLSTPTASPVVTNRSKSLPPKSKRINGHVSSTTSTLKRDKENSGQKFNWFASLDRLSKKKTREPSNDSTIDRKATVSRTKSTSMKNISSNNSNGSSKTLRFFGDTDRDEVDSISRATSKKLTSSQERLKSLSLQNLNAQRKVKQTKSVSRSRAELQNISESTSDTEFNGHDVPIRRPPSPVTKHLPPPRPPKSSKLVSAVTTTLPRPPRRKMFDDEHDYSHNEGQDSIPYSYQKKGSFESDSLSNLTSARRLRESLSASRENLQRDRFGSDASQRSVVYLHATTVGDIPSQKLDRRKISGKNTVRTAIQEEKPMMRSVNRSVSLNAPWKPKFISDGYEINYNNDVQKGKYHQNQLRSKSASREPSSDRKRWDRDTPKRI